MKCAVSELKARYWALESLMACSVHEILERYQGGQNRVLSTSYWNDINLAKILHRDERSA